MQDKSTNYVIGSLKKFDDVTKKFYQLSGGCLQSSPPSLDQCKLFTPILPLAHPIHRQTYSQWKYSMFVNTMFRRKRGRTLYLLPIGPFPDSVTATEVAGLRLWDFLRDFASAFFHGLDVRVLPEVPLENINCTKRVHDNTNQTQVFVGDLFPFLQKMCPPDGHSVIGISWTDLYPSEDLNFVLGEASFVQHSAAISFGRFEPKLYKDGQRVRECGSEGEDEKAVMLLKLVKSLCHETCHLMGLAHCVFFQCLMNESSSMEQAFKQPMFLCPVCLRKLQKICRFDIRERYLVLREMLLKCCEAVEPQYFADSAEWLDRCLSFLDNRDEEEF
ncbi:archaemetzincin-2-like [Branchiostoma lanceolatum]|uniref:archaemetzincin-2-like n=1 Tax=Branchiostoma lanceolatum TaxID=7740 RepID=UPI00345171F8